MTENLTNYLKKYLIYPAGMIYRTCTAGEYLSVGIVTRCHSYHSAELVIVLNFFESRIHQLSDSCRLVLLLAPKMTKKLGKEQLGTGDLNPFRGMSWYRI